LTFLRDFELTAIRDCDFHDKYRKIFGQALSNTALTKFEPTVRERLDKVVEMVENESSKGTVDLSAYCKYLALDVPPQPWSPSNLDSLQGSSLSEISSTPSKGTDTVI
jgi:hypothetical protein